MKFSDFPYLGFGLGLRHEHLDDFFADTSGEVSWVEVITENFIAWKDGKRRNVHSLLERIRAQSPVVLHGTSLSLGAAEPLDENFLSRLRDLALIIQPEWISDHLCWSSSQEHQLHNLLPLPYTEETIGVVVEKIMRVQDVLKRRILVENLSTYLEFSHSEMTEWEFVVEVLRRADCGMLLDVNNIYVSSVNHGFDPKVYLEAIPVERVGQIHLAGHRNLGTHLFDSHDEPVCPDVWTLYRSAAERFGKVNTMVEWDDKIPSWPILVEEVKKAHRIWREENEVPAHSPRGFAEALHSGSI